MYVHWQLFLDVRGNLVRILFCPHYEGLTCEDIWEFTNKYPNCQQYWPDERDRVKIPRAWLVNMCFTVIGSDFEEFVSMRVADRNQKLLVDREMMVEVDEAVL